MADFRLWHVEQVFAALALRVSPGVLATVASCRCQVVMQLRNTLLLAVAARAFGGFVRSHCGVDFDHVSLLW